MTKDVRNFSRGHHLEVPRSFVPRLRSKNKLHSRAMGTLPDAGCQITLHKNSCASRSGARDRHSAAKPGRPALLRQIGASSLAAAEALDERQRALGQAVGRHATPGRGGGEYTAQPVGSTQTGRSWTASSDFSQRVAASSGTRLQAPRAAAGRATLAGRASRWLSDQVVYSVNGAVVARARTARAGAPRITRTITRRRAHAARRRALRARRWGRPRAA